MKLRTTKAIANLTSDVISKLILVMHTTVHENFILNVVLSFKHYYIVYTSTAGMNGVPLMARSGDSSYMNTHVFPQERSGRKWEEM